MSGLCISPTTARSSRTGSPGEVVPAGQGGPLQSLLLRRAPVPAEGGCERNHVELRKLLPKRRGISFDDLEAADMAAVMSQLNPEPRPRWRSCPAVGAPGRLRRRRRRAHGRAGRRGGALRRAAARRRGRQPRPAGEGADPLDLARGDNREPLSQARPAESGSAPGGGPRSRAPKSSRTAGRGPRPLSSWGKEDAPAGPSGYLGKRHSPRGVRLASQFNLSRSGRQERYYRPLLIRRRNAANVSCRDGPSSENSILTPTPPTQKQ